MSSVVSYIPGQQSLVESDQIFFSAAGQTQIRQRWQPPEEKMMDLTDGQSLSEAQQEAEALFIKTNVLLKRTGRSKLGNVTPFKHQSSRIIDLWAALKYGTGSWSGNRKMSAAAGDDPRALFLHAFHSVISCLTGVLCSCPARRHLVFDS